MNQQQQWQTPVRSGGGGSVKRARQRMEAGLPRMAPSPDQKPKEMEDPRPAPSPPRPVASPQSTRRPQPTQAIPETKTGPGPIGVAISNPTQIPQWPLQGTIEHINDSSESNSSPPRGPPPQRPPRPSRVPSILDSSRVQAPMPGFRYVPQQQRATQPREPGRSFPQQPQAGRNRSGTTVRAPEQPPRPVERLRLPSRAKPQQYQQQYVPQASRTPIRLPMNTQTPVRSQPKSPFDDAASPVSSTPSSRPSTTSSAGSIPDFPLPVPLQKQRSINLGPPPSSRKGASSYYSQASFVSPIPEVSERESPRTQLSHGSYASSAAIPSSWGDDSPGFRSDGYDDFEDNVIDERGESRASTLDDNDGRTLIRSASLGKRAKPSMVNTKSAEKVETAAANKTMRKSKLERMGFPESIPTDVAVGAAEFAAARMAERDTPPPTTGDDSLASGTGLYDNSGSSSTVSALDVASAVTTDEVVPPPQARLGDKNSESMATMLGAYNAASSIGPGGGPPKQGYSRLSAIRRPPRLDIDAVRDAEARGSLTSLPDLIKRATRLAYMIDKGKRPGSGMDLNDFPSLSPDNRDKKAYRGLSSDSDEKRQSGLSGMLAAFPPPGPTPSRLSPRPESRWPEVDYDPTDPDQAKGGKPKRKCCGLSLPVFLVLLFISLIVITAAIVIPLKLLVLDKKTSNRTYAAAAASTLGSCQSDSTTACQNGGTTIIMTDNQCGCICINGFTGSTCTIAGATGCTTANLTSANGSNLSNVTLGASLPRLISQANTNFSIPLSADNILARFNAASLSCSTQNALVTFGGPSDSDANPDHPVTSTAAAKLIRQATHVGDTYSTDTIPPISTTTTSYTITTTLPPGSSVSTTDVSATPTPTSTPTSSSPSSSAASTASTASISTSTSVFTASSKTLDFARIAVLFILQQEDLTSATKAQSALQKVFSQDSLTTAAAQNVPVGGANAVDLINFTLTVGNGTVGGGVNGTTGTAKMKRMAMFG